MYLLRNNLSVQILVYSYHIEYQLIIYHHIIIIITKIISIKNYHISISAKN